MFIIGVLVWIGLSMMVGLLGRTKILGFWGFFILSVVLSPVTGFLVLIFFEIIALVSEANKKKKEPQPERQARTS